MISLHKRSRCVAQATVAVVVLSGSMGVFGQSAPAGPQRVAVADCEIRVLPTQPVFVMRAVEDLRSWIRTGTGRQPLIVVGTPAMKAAPALTRSGAAHEPPVDKAPLSSLPPRAKVVIDVGLHSPTELLGGNAAHLDRPGSYVLRIQRADTSAASVLISVAACEAQGLKFGVMELIRQLQCRRDAMTVPVPLCVKAWPTFALRGMYAHLHWSYNHPWALRSWQVADWKRYLDFLTYLGFNTIQLWPMMELLPHPLSDADRAYLESYAEIVDYAHEQRGMKVFIGSCPNSITEDARGVPIAQREYFDFEKRLNPADPRQFDTLMEYRSDLYRTVPNADGYWVIDSDPGGWKGSPSSDFVKVLLGHRRWIERFGRRPSEQPLIYWMWLGWGTGSREQNRRETLTLLARQCPGPWRVHVCTPEHINLCRELGLMGRAIWFPYNLVEDEPGAPLTDLRSERIAQSVRSAREAGIDGVLGNAQTPLAQLPNIAVLASRIWQRDVSASGADVLDHLADGLAGRWGPTVRSAWEALDKADATESLRLAEHTRALSRDDSARGGLSLVLGDWRSVVLEDLAFMLTIHARAVAFNQWTETGAAPVDVSKAFGQYLESVLAWLKRTGYHNRRAVTHRAYVGPVNDAFDALERTLGRQRVTEQILAPALSAVREKEPDAMVDVVLDALCEQCPILKTYGHCPQRP